MKKILQINILNETGSTGRIMQGISKSLIMNGYEVYTAYGYGDSKLNNSFKIGNTTSYIAHNIGSRLFCNQGLYSKKTTRKLIEFINDKDIDLIHLHNIHGNYLNYVELFNYIKEKNIPIIWTLHDCWPFTGKCTHFDLCKCEKWKTGCFNCPNLQQYPISYMLDRTKQNYDLKKKIFTSVSKMYFVSPSIWLANLFKYSFLNKYPITVINNGINIKKFYKIDSDLRKKYNIVDKKVILGVASPWNDRKGFKDFINLADLLDSSYQIVLIGVSNTQKKKLNKNIIAINKTNDIEELAKWYSLADVFVNLTYEDNFPTVNLESLACGTPVITYKTGGSIEVINENTGLICNQGDIKEVKESIDFICSHKSQYYNCDVYARERFDEEQKFYEYVSLYNIIFEE